MAPQDHDGSTRDRQMGRRPLTESERSELLDLPVPAVFSTLTRGGTIHSVPVHFLSRDAELRIIAERDSVKCRNARRTGRATMCVVATVGPERRYATMEGRLRIDERVEDRDLAMLGRRYGLELGRAADDDYADSVTLTLLPEGWIAWTDFD
jgi:hypothetical protein